MSHKPPTDLYDVLRQAVHETPSAGAFSQILGALQHGKDFDPQTYKAVWLPYAQEHIARWRAQTSPQVIRAGRWTAISHAEIVDPLAMTRSGPAVLEALSEEMFGFGLIRTLRLHQKGRWKGEGLKSRHGALLAQNASLETLEGLCIQGQRLGRDGVSALLSSPHLKNLRALSIKGAALGASGVQGIAMTSTLKDLEMLVLIHTQLGGGISQLARSPHLKNLRTLVLDANGLIPSDAKKLAASQNLGQLTHLSLNRNNSLQNQGVSFLANSPGLGALERLELSDTHMHDDGFEDLVTSQGLGALRVLEVCANDIHPHGIRALAQSSLLGQLRRLDLRGNHLGDDGAQVLASSSHCRALKELDLGYNELGDLAAMRIANSPHLRGLTSLVLIGNGIGPSGAESLAGSDLMEGLEVLELSDNPIGDKGLAALLQSPHLGSLRQLQIANIQMSDQGARALSQCEALSNLERLVLVEFRASLSEEAIQILKASPHIGHLIVSF